MNGLQTKLLQWRLRRDCREYAYRKLLEDGEVGTLLHGSGEDFSDRIAAELVAGCVRLTAVLYGAGGKVWLGYDLYVKDAPDAAEWILYENLTEAGDTREGTMLKILDEAVTAHGLSYTECSFTKLPGTVGTAERK